MEFHSAVACPPIPDDLTLPQFLLDNFDPSRPLRKGNPWLVENATGRAVGFEEIRTRVFGLANALSKKWNVGERDVVCIFSPNHVDYPVAVWATHRLGAIVSPANPSYTSDELLHQLKTSKSTVLLATPESFDNALSAAKAAGIPEDRVILFDGLPGRTKFSTLHDLIKQGLSEPPRFMEKILVKGEARTKIAFLCFSSGTTGRPKAVAIPHYAPIANVLQLAGMYRINDDSLTEGPPFRSGDAALAILPFYHIYGLVVTMHFILFGGLTIVVVPKFDFADMLNSIVKYNITNLFIVPPMAVLLSKHPLVKKYDLGHVRFCISGAAALSGELVEQLKSVLPNASIGQGFGMTETSTVVSAIPLGQKIGTPGASGRLLPGTIARVVKQDGSLATYDEEGELLVAGPQNALEYFGNEEATRETFVDGWVRTGDEVRIAPNGDLFVVDRLKEILKVRGFQVAPAELEGHLIDHAEIADVCVVGITDDFSGEVPLAFVVLKEAAAKAAAGDPKKEAELKTSIKKHVSDAKIQYKWLAGGVEFIDAIPRNPSGKLLRRLLREKAKELKGQTVEAKAKL